MVCGSPKGGYNRRCIHTRLDHRAGKKQGSRAFIMKVFMIDNYDSFTYNLVQYFQILGAEVVVRETTKLPLRKSES